MHGTVRGVWRNPRRLDSKKYFDMKLGAYSGEYGVHTSIHMAKCVPHFLALKLQLTQLFQLFHLHEHEYMKSTIDINWRPMNGQNNSLLMCIFYLENLNLNFPLIFFFPSIMMCVYENGKYFENIFSIEIEISWCMEGEN